MQNSSPTPQRVHPQSAASHPPAPSGDIPGAPPDGPTQPPAPPRIVAGLCDFTDVDTIYDPQYRTLHITTATFKRHHHFLDQANPIPTDDIVAAADAIYAELDDDREHFTILTCDARPQIYGFKVVASGSICRVDVAHDTVLRSALLLGARAIILLHNHPSGHLRPSSQDIILTNRLHFLASMLNIELLDHFTYHPTAGALSMRPFFPQIWSPDPDPYQPTE